MKRITLLFTMLFPMVASAQTASDEQPTSYKPVLSEDKCWTMSYKECVSPEYGDVYTYKETMLEDETVIGGIRFMREYEKSWTPRRGEQKPEEWTVTNRYLGEDGGKVYLCDGTEESIRAIIDFSLDENEIYPMHGEDGAIVTAVSDTILASSTDKVPRKCMHLSIIGIEVDVWVEGIGSLKYGLDGLDIGRVGAMPMLGKCVEGDNIIFQLDDFNVQPATNPVDTIAYRPLVEEGKHWTYDNYMPLRPAEYDHYYYYDLKGDTLIAGHHCLKLYSENRNNANAIRYEGALYEVNKKVYCFFPAKDKATLLYDFDCAVGDTVNVSVGKMVVKNIQMEQNGDITIKKYTLYSNDVGDNVFWIEGVGAPLDFFGMLPLSGNYNSLNACELNGEKLYQIVEPELTANGYHKMGIEGKRWNYIHYYIDEEGAHYEPYSYVVKGDTIIRRTRYKKLYYQDEKTERLECLLFEEGRTVYKKTDLGNNALKSFFYFDREDFGRVFTWEAKNAPGNTNWMVYGIDTIKVNNRQFRRYTCLQKYSEEGEKLTTIEYKGDGVWHDIWVEGVGSATSGIEDQIPFHEPPVRAPGEYTAFVSCYEDGECIFTADDFYVQSATNPVDSIAYRPFVEDGKVWKVGAISGNPVQVVDYYYFEGDTIIGGKTCKQMMCQRYVSPENPDYDVIMRHPLLKNVGAWYEEDKKVYTYDAINKQFKMVYDFYPETTDTLQIDYFYECIIGPKQTGGLTGFKGVHRDLMCYGDGAPYYNTTWLEGVGGIDGPTRNIYYETDEYVSDFLMSCAVGDEVIYLNDNYEDGTTPEGARKDRFDFTHTIKTKPKAPSKSGLADAETAEVQSLYGEYNDLRLGINLDPLDDAYQVSITNESGKVVYEKAVNAGSVVALNIDISAYAKGRYTVTVENSRESFTGQFETQTQMTGIETAISNNKVVTGNCIYNLQGQRIRRLQKGLNIVNGQKVVKSK